jgi:Flp pilus assembly pilin Flp
MIDFIGSSKKFIQSEAAPTMVEYGLVVALIAIIAAAAVSILGTNAKGVFSAVAHSV